ncbi:MAG: Dabb family protein [Cytophagales bacterium]|nr:Dabb family protein [Cytophagales bacterium]
MKRILPLILFLTIAVMSSAQEKLLQHVVLFEFKTSAKPEDIKKIENAFSALSTTIKEIKKFEWGTNNSPENLNQGFTHCFIVSFASEKDRDIYLPHPEHKKFVSLAGPFFEKVLVVDYWQQH